MRPIVAITLPVDGQKFPADANVDTATNRYKTKVTGTVTTTTAINIKLKFKFRGTVEEGGSTPITAGAFTFDNVLLPEDDALVIAAELTDATGVVSGEVKVIVDTHPPTMTGTLTQAANASRRAGGVDLSWTKGTDYDPATKGTRDCAHIEVRRSDTAITGETQWSAATAVSTTVAGALTSSPFSTGRMGSFFYALRCFDLVDNMSSIVTNPAPAITDFIETTFTQNGATEFGEIASSAFDFNGDAVPDLAVGSNGKVFVYFGHAPLAPADTPYSTSSQMVITSGASPPCESGASCLFGGRLAILEDFDGDGTPDLAIGSPVDGKVYIVSGTAIRPSSTPTTIGALGSKVLTIGGDSTTLLLGLNVQSAGHFDGDATHTAVAIRGFYGACPACRSGVALVKGRAIDGSSLTLPAARDLFIRAENDASQLGFALSAQDLDGDGKTDLILGDHGNDVVYTFGGTAFPAAPAPELKPSTDAKSNLKGSAGDFFGYSIGLPGAISTTGWDMVIGAYNAGSGRIFLAKGTGFNFAIGATDSFSGTKAGQHLGNVVLHSPPGRKFDVDKDGHADILACNRADAGGVSGKATCYLFYGQTFPTSYTLEKAARTFAFETTPDNTGVAVPIADIDSDGYEDFAILAPGASYCRIVR